MLEFIDRLNLGEWLTFVIVVCVLWKFLFKSLVDAWFKNRLDLKSQEIGSALQIQKDVALKQAEFEKVKLERVLPLFEEVNSAILEHRMVFNDYIYFVSNSCGSTERLEEIRLNCDERMIVAISALSIYLPDEFRAVVYRLRTVVSCCAKDTKTTGSTLRSLGAIMTIPPLAKDLYNDLIDCFHSMSAKYLGVSDEEKSYSELLSKYSLDSKAKTTKKDPENALAYKFLLLHGYYAPEDQLEAQSAVEKLYRNIAESEAA